ncbi:FIG00657500: hypothetical protein [hydrothermal vent metagenome]|uniref:DUF4381 domain-containing protein n=1 Tax=hydrothermal vent metagenome TaxID=652676 RepID=A0A3B0X249_9ZZZZ
MNEQTLNLRDIHLPDAISWWPLAPGWWILLIATVSIILFIFIARKIYISKQLKRDIHRELDDIKTLFQQTQNKSQLARSLSVLLRRASISYYPDTKNNGAGLTGQQWLSWLDNTTQHLQKTKRFQSDVGNVLINAPYLPENTDLDFDAETLIELSESWLLSKHKKMQVHST